MGKKGHADNRARKKRQAIAAQGVRLATCGTDFSIPKCIFCGAPRGIRCDCCNPEKIRLILP